MTDGINQNLFWQLWAKKLAGEASKEELEQMEELLKKHPELVYSAEKIEEIWKLKGPTEPVQSEDSYLQHLSFMEKEGVDLSLLKPTEKPTRTKFFTTKRWIYTAAAASVLAVIGFLLLYPPSQKPSPKNSFSEVSTRLGSKSKLHLPDGSTVWLNAGSKLTYDKEFGNGSRKVTLNGEAYFDVVKNPDLPFIIQTKSINIKVLGTAFNVRSYDDEMTTETSLIRGRVQITINKRPNEVFYLKPTEKLVVANESIQKVEAEQRLLEKIPLVSLEKLTYLLEDSLIVETSWKENKLVFKDESFYELSKKLEKWYNVIIHFEDKEIERIHLSGTFESETVSQALEALQITADFKFFIEGNNITIHK